MAAMTAATNPWTTIGVPALAPGYWKRGTRWNDALTGTWTSVDPLTRLNDPSRANPYHYAGNDPINLVDPTGRFWEEIGEKVLSYAAGAAAGATAGVLGLLAGPGAATIAATAVGGCVAGMTEEYQDGKSPATGCVTGLIP